VKPLTVVVCGLLAAVLALATACGGSGTPAPAPAPTEPPAASANIDALAALVDPFVPRTRVLVMTDIANEPDDQMSLVRFLVYSTDYDVEGLVASTSTWMRNKVRPDVIESVLAAYGEIYPTLSTHARGFAAPDALRRVVVAGQPSYGMAAVGADKSSAGADLIVRAVDAADTRPLWVLAWGGANTLAQALLQVRATRTTAELATFVSKLRVYAISDQDDAGPWIRREFPSLHYIAKPSTPDGDEYASATWTGISGDRFYRNAPGADFETFTDRWVNTHIRAKGPLGRLYPMPCCIHEGDTPTFLGLINNGLASAMSPTYGGWGGRYVWRRAFGESRPAWTQGGDSYPGRDHSRDTVVGIDGQSYTSDQATIWRWRQAFQHDFAARMDWTIKDVASANHNPVVTVNGVGGQAPLVIDAAVRETIALDAAGTSDPDGDALKYAWFYYGEAGTGIPGQPVFAGGLVPVGGGGNQQEGGIPPAGAGGPTQPAPRVTIQQASARRASVVAHTAGTSHVILAVEDDGTPSLTSYRRVIIRAR
jgi:Protein of unknown function (DUF1593)